MSENFHILTELAAQQHCIEFFYELHKGLKPIFASNKSHGKENSSSTHVSDLHPTSNMTHYKKKNKE
jgi:hypothetical protein